MVVLQRQVQIDIKLRCMGKMENSSRGPALRMKGIGIRRWNGCRESMGIEGDDKSEGQVPGQTDGWDVVGSCNQADWKIFVGVKSALCRGRKANVTEGKRGGKGVIDKVMENSEIIGGVGRCTNGRVNRRKVGGEGRTRGWTREVRWEVGLDGRNVTGGDRDLIVGWKVLASLSKVVVIIVRRVMQRKVLVGYWSRWTRSRPSASEGGCIVGGIVEITVNNDRFTERSGVKDAKGKGGASTKNEIGVVEVMEVLNMDSGQRDGIGSLVGLAVGCVGRNVDDLKGNDGDGGDIGSKAGVAEGVKEVVIQRIGNEGKEGW